MPGETQSSLTTSSGGQLEARLQALEDQVSRLATRLDEMEQRLSRLPLPSLPQAWPLPEPALEGPGARAETTRWLTLIGRSFLVLGGAFLIRALTDGRVLPGGLGVALGIAFAAAWIYFSHRAAGAGATLSAGFHGVAAAVIAYPLVLEATTRMGVMSPALAALTLVAFTGLLLVVSWRDRLGWLAWIGVLSCLATTIGLLGTTAARGELIAVLVVLAGATFFWLGDDARWRGLRWAPALVLDLVVLRAVFTSTPPVLLSSLALAGLSLALVLARTAAARPVGAFEVLQTVLGLGIGLTGTLRVAEEAGSGTGAVAAGVLAASLVTMGFAGWVVPHRGKRELDFLFHAALSVVLLALAVALLTAGELRGVLWAALALALVLLGRGRYPVTLWSRAALLALAAASGSGLMPGMWQALAGGEAMRWEPVGRASVVVFGLIVLAYLATVPPVQDSILSPDRWASARLPAAVLLALGSGGLATLALQALHPVTPDLARLGTARIAAAVVIPLGLALIRRRLRRPELSWIATLVLALGGVELLFVELPNGRASTLLVSFVVYGAGLILIPRLAPPGRDLLSSSGAR